MSNVPFPRGNGALENESATNKRVRNEEENIFGLKRTRRIEIVQSKAQSKKTQGTITSAALLKSPLSGAMGLGMTRSSGTSKAVKIDNMSFAKYKTGTLALGFVLQIYDNNIVISLPGGVAGTVTKSEISDALHKLSQTESGSKKEDASKIEPSDIRKIITLMQPVRCYVLDVIEKSDSKRKSLVLSMRSSLVNRGLAMKHMIPGFPISGCISSKEDHGYIVSAGVSDISFFLPFKAVPLALFIDIGSSTPKAIVVTKSEVGSADPVQPSAPPAGSNLCIGQPIECIVETVNETARSVTLRAQRKAIAETVTKGDLLPFNALSPGMKFNVMVEKIVQNGLLVKFMNDFHGVIDNFSLSRPMASKELQNSISEVKGKEGISHEARIVFVDHGSRSIRMSMRPHVLDMRAPANLPELGSTLNNLDIKCVAKKQGILLSLGGTEAADAEAILTSGIVIKSTDSSSAVEGRVKGAARLDKKMLAADAKRRKEINESVLGVFIHKSALADRKSDPATDEGASSVVAKGSDAAARVSESDIEKQYKVGEQVELVKIIGYHLVEGVSVGTNVSATISSEVLHWSKISVGQTLSASIAAIKDFGLIIKISAKVQAVCPLLHLSDTGLALTTMQLNKRFKVGQIHKFRVWEADGSAIMVTMKKSIVDDKESPILSYDDISEGGLSLGVVSRVSEKGLKVNFFNKVRGTIPMSILAHQGVADAADSYRAGQVIKCLVLSKETPKGQGKKAAKGIINTRVVLALALGTCDAAEVQSLLSCLAPESKAPAPIATTAATEPEASLSLTDAQSPLKEAPATAPSGKRSVGEFVSGVVYKVDVDGVSVRLSDGRLGTMQKHQSADFASTADAYFTLSGKKTAQYSIGTKIVNALVLSVSKKVLALSVKPLLLAAAADDDTGATSMETISVPDAVADLVPGQLVAGFIFKVESYGVMVRFREGLTALVPRPNVADRFVATPEGLFNVGDSVRCVIQRVDLVRERVIATFKSGMVGPSNGSTSYLKAMLRENYLALSAKNNVEGKALPSWRNIALCSVVSATVSSVESYGLVLTGADQTTMMLARGVHSKASVQVGQVVDVLVLDVDFKNNVLDVTLDALLIANVTAKGSQVSASKSKSSKKDATLFADTAAALSVKGSILKGKVQLVQSDGKYLVVSVGNCVVAYVSVADYHCPSPPSPSEYVENQEISLRVESPAHSAEGGEGSNPHFTFAILSVFAGVAHKDESLAAKKSSLTSPSGKVIDAEVLKRKFLDSIRLGQVLKWRVISIGPLEMVVKPDYVEVMGLKVKATVHLTGTLDQTMGTDDLHNILTGRATRSKNESEIGEEHPFYGISVGGRVLGRIQQIRHDTKVVSDKGSVEGSDSTSTSEEITINLSTVGLARGLKFDANEPKTVGKRKREAEGEADSSHSCPLLQLYGKNAVKLLGVYAGCITKMEETGCTVSFSPYITSRLHFMDVSSDESVVKLFKERAFVGQRVLSQVTSFNLDSKNPSKTKPKGINISRATIEHRLSTADSLNSICDAAITSPTLQDGTAAYAPGAVTFGILDLRSFLQRGRIPRPPAFQVYLGGGKVGRVCITELSDPADWQDCAHIFRAPSSSSSKADIQLPDGSKHGDLVRCRVIAVNGKSTSDTLDVVELSLRPSRLACKNKKESIKPDPIPSDGSVITAYVANYNTKGKGCFLRVSHGMTGQVLLRNLSDDFVTEPLVLFPVGRLLSTYVLSASQTEGTAKLTLKQSVIIGDKKAAEDIKGIFVRSTVEGTVLRISPIGVHVTIKGTSIVGLCRKSAACEDSDEMADLYEVGAFVRAKVLSVSRQSKKVSLGLKASFFSKEDKHGKDNADVDSDDDDSDEDHEASVSEEDDDGCIKMLDADDESDDEMDAIIKAATVRTSSDKGVTSKSAKTQRKPLKIADEVVVLDISDEEEEEEDDDSDSDDESDAGPSIFAPPKVLKAGSSSSMQWTDFKPKGTVSSVAAAEDGGSGDDSEEEEEEVEDAGKGSRTRQKESAKRKDERAIRAREISLEAGNSLPERPEDFERLLLAEPSSSLLWVQYMSHYLLQADIDATRQIAEKALRSINFKEEGEKLNVWMAYVNMEYKYGDMVSLDSVFKRAVAESKGKTIHLNLAEAYEAAEDTKGATAIYDKALKKYKTSKKVWMAFQHFRLRIGDSDGAKSLLSRSMQSLSRHKHIEVLIKYAVCEYDVGSEDRGRSVFEDLVGSYPKRTDLWHVYVDKEVKCGNQTQARQLFERMILSKSSAKAMKAAFKKFLSFEQLHGSEAQQEAVKEKARNYVSSMM